MQGSLAAREGENKLQIPTSKLQSRDPRLGLMQKETNYSRDVLTVFCVFTNNCNQAIYKISFLREASSFKFQTMTRTVHPRIARVLPRPRHSRSRRSPRDLPETGDEFWGLIMGALEVGIWNFYA
jgi:hypothetical protein